MGERTDTPTETADTGWPRDEWPDPDAEPPAQAPLDQRDETHLSWAYDREGPITDASEWFDVTYAAVHRNLVEAGIHDAREYDTGTDDSADDAATADTTDTSPVANPDADPERDAGPDQAAPTEQSASPDTDAGDGSPGDADDPIPCPVPDCSRTYPYRTALREHAAQHHVHEQGLVPALLALSGVGPVLAGRIASHFDHDPTAVLNAAAAEMARVRGVGSDTAARILEEINVDQAVGTDLPSLSDESAGTHTPPASDTAPATEATPAPEVASDGVDITNAYCESCEEVTEQQVTIEIEAESDADVGGLDREPYRYRLCLAGDCETLHKDRLNNVDGGARPRNTEVITPDADDPSLAALDCIPDDLDKVDLIAIADNAASFDAFVDALDVSRMEARYIAMRLPGTMHAELCANQLYDAADRPSSLSSTAPPAPEGDDD